MIVVWLFLVVPWVGLQFVIVVSPDHTHLLFLVIRTCFLHVVLQPSVCFSVSDVCYVLVP